MEQVSAKDAVLSVAAEEFFWEAKNALQRELNFVPSVSNTNRVLSAKLAPISVTSFVAVTLFANNEQLFFELEMSNDIEKYAEKMALIDQKAEVLKITNLKLQFGTHSILISKFVKDLASLLREIKRIDHA